MTPRVVTIYISDGGGYSVHEGEACAHWLCWDEMLGQVAAMTIPRPDAGPLFRMHTPDGLVADMERRAARSLRQPNPPLQIEGPK